MPSLQIATEFLLLFSPFSGQSSSYLYNSFNLLSAIGSKTPATGLKGSSLHFLIITDLSFFLSFLWLCHTACGTLVPQPEIEPRPSAVRVQSPNHWTAREFPQQIFFYTEFLSLRLQIWGNENVNLDLM